MLRQITKNECKISIHIEQDDQPVRGNAMASGDDTADRECENKVLARLNVGDVWAWANVEVCATWNGITGSDYLGGCSYADEADFKTGGYYDSMVSEAVGRINETLAGMAETVKALEI